MIVFASLLCGGFVAGFTTCALLAVGPRRDAELREFERGKRVGYQACRKAALRMKTRIVADVPQEYQAPFSPHSLGQYIGLTRDEA